MEETTKIAFKKILNKTNFSSTLSVAIDSNVNIKTILNAHAYLFDEKVECGSGKAILTGRIGLKVVYVDTDGISNTITDSQAISENIMDAAITADSNIVISNQTVLAQVISSDGVLKVGCETSILPVLYFNIPLSNKFEENEKTICKKTETYASVITNYINSSFDYTTSFETKDTISKILCHDTYFTPVSTQAKDGSIYIEGKLYSRLVFETEENGEVRKKELCDTFNVATDVEANDITSNCTLDLCFKVDKAKENITTEIEDGNSIITIANKIKVCGVASKDINVELLDDIFSTENELEISTGEREFTSIKKCENFKSSILGETTLADNEPAIDEVVSNLNITPEITNLYLKNNVLHLEGIISSNLVYVDENKLCQHKHLEMPFVLNTKLELEQIENVSANISVADCKIKVKRGTIIEAEYIVEADIHIATKQRKPMITSVNIGKPINFGDYDYQIYLAKQGETMWELCKRIKISPQELSQTNKNLPLVMNGGEKVIIKR